MNIDYRINQIETVIQAQENELRNRVNSLYDQEDLDRWEDWVKNQERWLDKLKFEVQLLKSLKH